MNVARRRPKLGGWQRLPDAPNQSRSGERGPATSGPALCLVGCALGFWSRMLRPNEEVTTNLADLTLTAWKGIAVLLEHGNGEVGGAVSWGS